MLEFILTKYAYQNQSCEVWRGCYAPILQMKKLRNERCRESLMDIANASGHLGPLVSVALCFGLMSAQGGVATAVTENSRGVQLLPLTAMMHW